MYGKNVSFHRPPHLPPKVYGLYPRENADIYGWPLTCVNIKMSDIINGSASNLIKIAYTGFNVLPDEQWKCGIILELTGCIYMYGFSNCGLSYEEAKYCLCHIASDWML